MQGQNKTTRIHILIFEHQRKNYSFFLITYQQKGWLEIKAKTNGLRR